MGMIRLIIILSTLCLLSCAGNIQREKTDSFLFRVLENVDESLWSNAPTKPLCIEITVDGDETLWSNFPKMIVLPAKPLFFEITIDGKTYRYDNLTREQYDSFWLCESHPNSKLEVTNTGNEHLLEQREDFKKNCYQYLHRDDMSNEGRLMLIGGWWDLQEMKAITRGVK